MEHQSRLSKVVFPSSWTYPGMRGLQFHVLLGNSLFGSWRLYYVVFSLSWLWSGDYSAQVGVTWSCQDPVGQSWVESLKWGSTVAREPVHRMHIHSAISEKGDVSQILTRVQDREGRGPFGKMRSNSPSLDKPVFGQDRLRWTFVPILSWRNPPYSHLHRHLQAVWSNSK